MEEKKIVLGPMTINLDAMTIEELGSLVRALVDVVPVEDAIRLVGEWRAERGLAEEELE